MTMIDPRMEDSALMVFDKLKRMELEFLDPKTAENQILLTCSLVCLSLVLSDGVSDS